MCEPACIKYTGGSSFTCSDLNAARAAARTTYEAAVALFAMLCRQYSLNPLGNGVIISHKEGCFRDIATDHGDPEHLWTQLGLPYTMDTFRKAFKDKLGNSSAAGGAASAAKIIGTADTTDNADICTTSSPENLTSGYYRVRKSWQDTESQISAYRVLSYAKTQADKHPGYHVCNDQGVSVYPPAASYREYTVVKGDSLWAIAHKLLGDGDRCLEIKTLNRLTSDTLHCGQKLKIPNS